MLADCDGSGLYGWVKNPATCQHVGQFSITEGIGQGARDRKIWKDVAIDDAVRIPDSRGVGAGLRSLLHARGFIGGRVGRHQRGGGDPRWPRDMGPGHTIVTILCDGGARYQSKLFNPEFLRSKNLPLPKWMQ